MSEEDECPHVYEFIATPLFFFSSNFEKKVLRAFLYQEWASLLCG